ncbi:hypothetical protein C4587_02060 [Candidatus Parcubacteria bacterium]|nr:MAG: hypothetical protein C4587_02060 [Candidatus Parcubacteria bacterium]
MENFIPQAGSEVWFRRPDLAVDDGERDPSAAITMNRQRVFILTHGFGPFEVEEVRNGNGSQDGTVVVIRTLAGPKEVAVSRLAPELKTDFAVGERVTWANLGRLGSEFQNLLLEHRNRFGSGPFIVQNVVPASPWDKGSDLVEIEAGRERPTLESRFFAPA